MQHLIIIANGPPQWIAGSQWIVLGACVVVGVLLALFGMTRWRLGSGRACPTCRFDMTATIGLRCPECGREAADESHLRRAPRRVWLAAIGAVLVLAYPVWRTVAWSRGRNWTPPLSEWKTRDRVSLPDGGVARIMQARNPWPVADERCRIRAKDGTEFVIEDHSLSFGVEDPRHPAGRLGLGDADLTGDGVPDLIVSAWSGGAHCCQTYHVFELAGSTIRQVAVIDAREGGAFEDLDADGAYEFVTRDWSLAYALACFACLDYPAVILRCGSGGYVPATDLMRRDAPSPELFSSIVADCRDMDWIGDRTGARDHLWGRMLELIYTGHEQLAWRLYEESRPADDPQRETDLASFRDVLAQSPFRDAVASMQDEPASN